MPDESNLNRYFDKIRNRIDIESSVAEIGLPFVELSQGARGYW